MRTLYSLTLLGEDGGTTIVDYLDELGWRRHEFDRLGGYLEVAPCTAGALDALREDTATAIVHELRKATEALSVAVDDIELRAAASFARGIDPDPPPPHPGPFPTDTDRPHSRPDPYAPTNRDRPHSRRPPGPLAASSLARLRRDRRELLQRLARACSEGWRDAIGRLARASADDQAAIARAARALEFMRASRALAVRALAEDAGGSR
jgi:hypothetical protein